MVIAHTREMTYQEALEIEKGKNIVGMLVLDPCQIHGGGGLILVEYMYSQLLFEER